jgi:hypothetical protein
MPGTDPYPLRAIPWLPRSAAPGQQNPPFDNPPDFFGLDVGSTPIPFWGDAVGSLDPGNSQFPVWDVVLLNGQTLPGLCAVTGKRAKRYDVKKSKGVDGATLTGQGFDLADIKIVERLWTREHLNALYVLMPVLEAPSSQVPGQVQSALQIYHPALALRSIFHVVIEHVSLLHPSSVRDVWEQEIQLKEYRPVKAAQNVTETVAGAINTAISDKNGQTQKGGVVRVALPGSNSATTGPNGARGN